LIGDKVVCFVYKYNKNINLQNANMM